LLKVFTAQSRVAPRSAPSTKYSLSRKVGLTLDTTIRVLLASVASDVPWVFCGALVGCAAFLVWTMFASGATPLSINGDLASLEWVPAAVAAGFVFGSIRSFRRYLFDGSARIRALLQRSVPQREALEQAELSAIEFHFRVLKYAGSLAFAYELGFQICAFALATWGVVATFPQLGLFLGVDTLSIAAAFSFWIEALFSIVDAPATLGLSSGLTPDTSVWPFGLVIIFFKVALITAIIRMISMSVQLKPIEISEDLNDFLSRGRRANVV
jgi:hypothetical protein